MRDPRRKISSIVPTTNTFSNEQNETFISDTDLFICMDAVNVTAMVTFLKFSWKFKLKTRELGNVLASSYRDGMAQ